MTFYRDETSFLAMAGKNLLTYLNIDLFVIHIIYVISERVTHCSEPDLGPLQDLR